MRSAFRRTLSIFVPVFILLGVSGINISGAAARYTVPTAPFISSATGGLESAVIRWQAPAVNGGKPITSYKVYIYPGGKIQVCTGSVTACTVNIANPNKPSPKPLPVSFYFKVAAVNSIGTGGLSNNSAWASVRFRATIYIAPKYGTPTPTPTPTPTSVASGIVTFDGSYAGQIVLTITTSTSTPPTLSTLPATFTIANGIGTGGANGWTANGRVTDPIGVAQVSVSNPLYGTMSFTVTFTQDPVTKVMSGNGKGTQTFSYPGMGDVKVEFVFSVSKGGTA